MNKKTTFLREIRLYIFVLLISLAGSFLPEDNADEMHEWIDKMPIN